MSQAAPVWLVVLLALLAANLPFISQRFMLVYRLSTAKHLALRLLELVIWYFVVGAVMVVAELPDGRLVLERQFRYPVQSVMVEFPAGKLDPGEDSLVCAQRELLEETGYTARQWARAGVLHPVISYSTEFIDIWFARELTAGQRQLDAGEFLDVFSASTDELLQWCRDGRITDAKTLTGVLWLQNLRSGAWSLDWASV